MAESPHGTISPNVHDREQSSSFHRGKVPIENSLSYATNFVIAISNYFHGFKLIINCIMNFVPKSSKLMTYLWI